MNYAVSGLKDEGFTTHASALALAITRASQLGYADLVSERFVDLLMLVDVAVEDDLQYGNPALTEWRLDQFNDWLRAELKVVGYPRHNSFPAWHLNLESQFNAEGRYLPNASKTDVDWHQDPSWGPSNEPLEI